MQEGFEEAAAVFGLDRAAVEKVAPLKGSDHAYFAIDNPLKPNDMFT